jgi:MOSC domain-containing protein YiiM
MGMVHWVRYVSDMIISQIDVLLIGQPKPFHADGTMSAMARMPVDRPVFLGKHGFAGDQVADPTVHGGADKAVHFYPAEHYPKWIAHFAGEGFVQPLLDQAGAFGENISASGLTEDSLRIGDRFRIGRALVEVAQGRQPCWKLDHHFGVHGLSGAIINGGHCGGYFRVIEEGDAEAGDAFALVDRPLPDWTVRRVFDLIVAGKNKNDKAAFRALADMDVLFDGWRKIAAERLRD